MRSLPAGANMSRSLPAGATLDAETTMVIAAASRRPMRSSFMVVSTIRGEGKPALFDHLVGNCEQRGGNGDAERFRGLQVDHELEPGRLFDRKVGRDGALQNPVDVVRSPTGGLWPVHAVRQQSVCFDIIPQSVDSRHRGA